MSFSWASTIWSQALVNFAFLLDRISWPFLFSLDSTYTSTSSPTFKSNSLNSERGTKPSDLKPIFKTTSESVIAETIPTTISPSSKVLKVPS